METFTLKLTREQLNLIAEACELSSRLRSGQLYEVMACMDDLTKFEYDHDKVENLVELMKSEIGLNGNESIGIRESTEKAKRLYDIYRVIYHYFAKKPSVYAYEPIKMSKQRKIEINN